MAAGDRRRPARRCATSTSTDDGTLSLEQLDASSPAATCALVALTHVSNVLGTINPVAEIVRRAHDAGALVLIDGAQAVPQMPVDLAAIDADFYAWTGHKALGPTGVGVLHARAELLEPMPPFLAGGDMIRDRRARSARPGTSCPGSSRPAPR